MSDFRLSVSKAKTFEACKKQYHYSYVLKVPQKEQPYTRFGRLIHLILELFHQAYLQGATEEPHKVMEQVFKTALKDPEFQGKLSTSDQTEAYAMCDQYLQKLASAKKPHPTILAVEKQFAIRISDQVVLNGLIDRVQLDPDGILHVLDYKTTKAKKYLANDFKQLLTYAYALLQEEPALTKVRGSYILLRHNFEYLTTEFQKDEIESIGQLYKESAEKMEAETEWAANPTVLCGWCSYLDQCKEGQKQVEKYNPNQVPVYGATSWGQPTTERSK